MKVKRIIEILKKAYPDVKCPLDHSSPLELLVATILAARCRDDIVNTVTKDLFKKYKTAEDYARAKPEVLSKDIKRILFCKAKAKNIIKMAQVLVKKYNGKVPDTMEDLTSLPGVGRKTANVVLGTAFGKKEGIAVDTHCLRLSTRLGLTAQKDPEKVEQDLMKIVPRDDWTVFTFLLVYHGRAKCKAVNPLCHECELNDLCPSSKK